MFETLKYTSLEILASNPSDVDYYDEFIQSFIPTLNGSLLVDDEIDLR